MNSTPPVPRSKPVLFLFLAIAAITLLLGLALALRGTRGERDAGPNPAAATSNSPTKL